MGCVGMIFCLFFFFLGGGGMRSFLIGEDRNMIEMKM